MTKRSVHIGSLSIRIPRSLAGQAAALAGGLGRQILRSIAESTAAKTGTTKIESIDAVEVRVGRNDPVGNLPKQVASQVGQQLRERLD